MQNPVPPLVKSPESFVPATGGWPRVAGHGSDASAILFLS
jgi:hypothetical protein